MSQHNTQGRQGQGARRRYNKGGRSYGNDRRDSSGYRPKYRKEAPAKLSLWQRFLGLFGIRPSKNNKLSLIHKSKGYAFVEMKKMEDAIRSVDILHNQPFMGRNLLVSGANERQEQPRQPREDRAPREEQGSMAEVKETSTPLLQPEAPAPQSQEQ